MPKVLMSQHSLKLFLEEQFDFYNRQEFIENDPVYIPHIFSKKEDIEISGFFAATIAWGVRSAIIKSGRKLMSMMDFAPHDFILNATAADLNAFKKFVHRTFNGTDCINFIMMLKNVYAVQGGMETIFTNALVQYSAVENKNSGNPFDVPLALVIHSFRNTFLQFDEQSRTKKHIADPLANSSSKRICMYLRWMVRRDNRGVDFGLWKNFSPQYLCCPLDMHSARVARELGLVTRKQNDWKQLLNLQIN